MSSILTNNGAMVALQTLKAINADLTKTQSMISTGKDVASARDNSAVWAISKVMEADVKGFKSISDSLALGQSTVAVARQASETVTDLLTEIKGRIVSAQEENVDREKIQTDIEALRDQISSVVGAAQFNGLNLLEGTDDVNVLSSLNRQSDGTVEASNIVVNRNDMTTSAGTNGVGGGGTDLSGQILDGAGVAYAGGTLSAAGNTAVIEFSGATGWDTGDSTTISIAGQSVTYTAAADDQTMTNARDSLLTSLQALDLEGVTFASNAADQIVVTSTRAFEGLDVAITDSVVGGGNTYLESINGAATGDTTTETGTVDQRAEEIFFTTGASVAEGNSYQVSIGGSAYFYTAGKGETFEDVARGLKTAVDSAGLDGITTQVAVDESTGQTSLKIDNSGADAALATAAMDGGTASGGLFGLDNIDVGSNAGASAALDNIETLIQNSIDAASGFGSAEGRIDTQSEFVSKLTDSLRSGIGAMVDADMEAVSARLQALQVQQQLGTQALSIANQAPQSILSLFR